VEIADQPNLAITVRDRDGSLIYHGDPAEPTTTLAKRTNQNRAIPATSGATKRVNPVNRAKAECSGLSTERGYDYRHHALTIASATKGANLI
jgi:hypothetical protein